MKKLSTTHEGQRDAYISELDKRFTALMEEHKKFDDLVREYNEKITAYNETLSEVRTWAEAIAAEMQQYVDEKSEKWPDTDTGQAYEEWKTAWEEFETEEIVAVEEPDDPSTDGTCTVATALTELPSDPE